MYVADSVMRLDEAIKHAEEVAIEQDKLCKRYDDASGYTRSHNEEISTADAKKCEKCANEHRQLAEWLKELKQLRKQTKWIPCNERLPKSQENGDRGITADKPSKGYFGRGKRRRAGKLRKSAGEFAVWRTWRADTGKCR